MREYLEKKLKENAGRKIIVMVIANGLDSKNNVTLDDYNIAENHISIYSGWMELDYTFSQIEPVENEGLNGIKLTSNEVGAGVEIYFLDDTKIA